MPIEEHGTYRVHKGDDEINEARRIPAAPDEPLPSDEDTLLAGRRVVRPNDSRMYPGRDAKSEIDRERKRLETEYWLSGYSEQESKERAAAAVRVARAKGEL